MNDWVSDYAVTPHLDKDVKAQVVNVVDVAQPKETSEESTGQHSHGEIQSNGQALSNNATTQEYRINEII